MDRTQFKLLPKRIKEKRTLKKSLVYLLKKRVRSLNKQA